MILRYLFPSAFALLVIGCSILLLVTPISHSISSESEIKTPEPLSVRNNETAAQISTRLIYEELDKNEVLEATSRPLFSVTRRKPMPVQDVEPTPAPKPRKFVRKIVPEAKPEPPKVQYVGQFKNGKKTKALLSNESDEFWVSVGDRVQGWFIEEITPEVISLKYGKEKLAIPIKR